MGKEWKYNPILLLTLYHRQKLLEDQITLSFGPIIYLGYSGGYLPQNPDCSVTDSWRHKSGVVLTGSVGTINVSYLNLQVRFRNFSNRWTFFYNITTFANYTCDLSLTKNRLPHVIKGSDGIVS